MNYRNHLDLLGLQAEDKVTGYSGVVTTVSFDLYGCVQAVLTPPADGVNVDGGQWFDVTRLKIKNSQPVMEKPDFEQGYIAEGRKGCAIKPAR